MKPRTKLIFSLKCLVLLSCFRGTITEEDQETEILRVELKMDDFELTDFCENIASAKKTAYLAGDYEEKIKQEEIYGTMIKTHFAVLKKLQDVPTELERNYTYQVKPGDGLLPQENWEKLILYKNRLESVELLQRDNSDVKLVAKSEYQYTLRTSRVAAHLNITWSDWQNIYNVSDIEAFPSHLHLLKEAAILNGFDTVQDYWEMLTDFQGAYSHADKFWDEISPFYNRLVNFVRTRIFKYYNVSQQIDEIPVYLLGVPLGNDWSNIADIILPHPQLHYDIESYLKYKDVKDIYKYSENIVNTMGLGSLGNSFWLNSNFNAFWCGPETFEFCDSGYTEIAECNQTSWKTYLDAHETALKIALNNIDYVGLTRQHLRYSGIDDAIETLGSLIAINSLSHHGILDDNNLEIEANMTKLLLTALRVMPRLSYYLMVDKWRLEEMSQNDTNIARRYWKYRKDYNGLKGETNNEPEYLEDFHILANKPYISKFFGTLVSFQLLEYYEQLDSSANIVEAFGKDEVLMPMIKERPTADWPYLLNLHYYGLEISSDALLKYFEPLEEYFATAPVEQVAIVTTTTTTTTTTTSTTTSSTTPKAVLKVLNGSSNNLDNGIVSDEPKFNASNVVGNGSGGPIKDSHVAMYVGVSLAILVASMLIAGYGYKALRRKRRTNNRRFDT